MNKVMKALGMADALMAGDPASFKAGYSRKNAELAVIEHLKLEGAEKESFLRIMERKHGEAA